MTLSRRARASQALLVLLGSLWAPASLLAAPAAPLRVVADLTLPLAHWAAPGGLRPALRLTPPAYGSSFLGRAADIRWDGDGHVLVAGVKDGTLRLPVSPTDRSPLERAFAPLPGSAALGAQVFLASSPALLVAAAPAHLMTWVSRTPSEQRPVSTALDFDSVDDLDLSGDRVLVLGLRRADDGSLAADGAIAWTAKLGPKLTDLHAVQLSESGPGAHQMDACTDMLMGKARFLPDGSFVVAPGAEPGIFVRNGAGKLLKAWPADLVGFDTGCPISETEMLRYSADVAARYRWLNQRRVLDEIVPLPGGIGFVVRSRSQGLTRWQLAVLSPDGKVARYPVPVTSPSEYARLAGDARGSRIAFLLHLDTAETPPANSTHVVLVELLDTPSSPAVNAFAALLLWACSALSHAEQGVIVQGPLQFEAVPSIAQASPASLATAQAIWVWSPLEEPQRLEPGSLRQESRRRLGSGHTLRVRIPAARGERAGALRLVAAPVEMWSEVPEPLLPSWPLPPSGRLTLPIDASRAWRLRVVGQKLGSFWRDLPAGARGAILAVVPASGPRFVVVGPGDRSVPGTSVRVSENSPGRPGGAKSWALLIGDEAGRFALPGLPDRSELRWLAAGEGRPPKLVVRAPSLLAKIVLDDGASVTGTLVDPRGHPIAGAAAQVEAWFSAEAPIPFTVNTQTDRQGRFTAKAVPPGKAMLVAVNPGWAPLRRAIEVPSAGIDLGRLALSRGDSLRVHVVDDLGEPIGGAEARPDLGAAARTGSDGLATLTHLSEDGAIRVVTTAEGHVRSSESVSLPLEVLEVRLDRAFVVSGRFLSSQGAPLPEAAVKAASGTSFETLPVDSDGSFRLDLRPGQDHTLTFLSPQAASLALPPLAGAPGERRDLGELHAPTASSVTGRLVDSGRGEPVPGGRVWCPRPAPQGPVLSWMGHDLLETSSGPDGTFLLEGVPPGPVRLRIEAPGFARLSRSVDVPAEGGAKLGDVALSQGSALVVTVGPQGGGAEVVVDGGGEALPFDRLTALVVDGVARIDAVAPGAARVSVARGSSILCETTVQVPSEARELAVECLAEGRSVHGVVLLGGRPVAGGALLWETPAGPLPEGVLTFKTPSGLTQQQIYSANRPAVEVPVGSGGSFATRSLRAGRWQVTFEPAGGGSTEALEVLLSEERDQTVALPFPGYSVSGTVLDADGKSVEEARVRELEGGATTLSEKDGSFRFEGLRKKTYFFRATKGDAVSEPSEVRVGEDREPDPLVLALLPKGQQPGLELRVLDDRGAPATGAFVFLEIPGQGLRVQSTDSSGTAKTVLDPPYPATLRAAAFVDGKWALGSWQTFDQAKAGLTLSVGPIGSIGIEAGAATGPVEITAPGGWNLTALLTSLGAGPFLAPGSLLAVVGLPTGAYTLKAAGQTGFVTVREGRRADFGFAKN